MIFKRFIVSPSVTLFAIPMGLIGLGLNGLHYAHFLNWSDFLPKAILIYGFALLFIVAVPYFWQIIQEVLRQKSTSGSSLLLQEWQHPFQISLFPSITLTFMLFFLALWQLQWWQGWLFWGYLITLILHSGLFLVMINRWIFDIQIELTHLKPTWFILLSGNFVAVISGLSLLPSSWHELLWFYLSASLLIWLVLVFSLFYQLIFIQQMPSKMRPTLFIFLAPPSLGTVASLLLFPNEQPSLMAWFFYSFATLMLLIWLFAIAHFRKSELSITSWAYVYPLAAYGLAGQYMAESLQASIVWAWSGAIFLITLALVILLSVHSHPYKAS